MRGKWVVVAEGVRDPIIVDPDGGTLGSFCTKPMSPPGGARSATRLFVGWVWDSGRGVVSDDIVASRVGFVATSTRPSADVMSVWLDEASSRAEVLLRLGTIVARLNELEEDES
ncbi:MAG: hypothetical protein ACOCXX_04360 [Planctomycetota bacterium]